jgi:hypothetical protein
MKCPLHRHLIHTRTLHIVIAMKIKETPFYRQWSPNPATTTDGFTFKILVTMIDGEMHKSFALPMPRPRHWRTPTTTP